jgi:integrase
MVDRSINRLTSKKVAKLLTAGVKHLHADGGGLYLAIVSKTNANWLRRYQPPGAAPRITRNGKTGYPARYMGLGSARVFTLKEARERNREVSKLLADGVDPLTRKRAERAAQAAEAAKAKTFGQMAEELYRARANRWSQKHRQQWAAMMLGTTPNGRPVRDDVIKPLRSVPVATINTPIVLSVLQPHWHKKTVTMSRARQRVEEVLDATVAAGFRPPGPNPAAWDVLKHLLPAPSKKEHFKALQVGDMPGFFAELRKREGIVARALEFTVLCASRTDEVLGAPWREIDPINKVWTIPADRMKGKREHQVPLSAAALELLDNLPREGDDADGFIFMGTQPGKPLSPKVMLRLLRTMGHQTVTAHGFRSTFSDWAHEQNGVMPLVIEESLAHRVGGATHLSYRRGHLLAQRRALMDAWAAYCMGRGGTAECRASASTQPPDLDRQDGKQHE